MKKNIQQTIYFCTGFILFILVFDNIIMFGISKSDKDQMGKINKVCNHSTVPEIAIFGSSVSDVGVSSEILQNKTGKTVYNYSLNGTPFYNYKGIIDEFNNNNNNTEIVIMSEAYFSLTKPTSISNIQNYLLHIGNPTIYNSLFNIQPELVWKCRYIPLYKYVAVAHTFYLQSIGGWKSFIKNNIQKDTLLGYNPVYRDWELDQNEIINKMKPFKIIPDSIVIKEYITAINALQKKGKKVCIILPPIYAEISNRLTDFTPLRQTFKHIANQTNSYFWDFTTSKLCENKNLFYNSNHLNAKGATIFSEILSDSIKHHITD